MQSLLKSVIQTEAALVLQKEIRLTSDAVKIQNKILEKIVGQEVLDAAAKQAKPRLTPLFSPVKAPLKSLYY